MSVLGPAIPDDPSQQLVSCAICGTAKKIAESIAIKVLLATGPGAIGSFECPAISHWGCSPEHATAAAHACLDEHIMPMLQQKIADLQSAQVAHAAAIIPTSEP